MRGLLVLFLLASGCGTEPPADAPDSLVPTAPAPLALSEVPSLDMTGRGGATGAPHTRPSPEARNQLMEDMRAATPLRIELSRALTEAPDWRAAEDAADRILPQLPESMRAGAESNASQRILRRIVALPTLTLEDVDALGEYTQSLIRLQSPEGDDVLRALIRLEGHWDPGMRASTARSAARRLGTAYAGLAECVGCTVEEALANKLPQRRQSLDPLLYEIQAVHSELMRIASHGMPMR